VETLADNMHTIKMNGREVFRFATRVMADAARVVVEKAGWRMEDVRLIVPHQANSRIIQMAVRRLKVPEDRVFMNLDRYGNTSSASVPIALCEALAEGRIEPGDQIVLVGFGAGLTWAAAAIEWAAPWPVTPQPRQQELVRRYQRVSARGRSSWRRVRRRLWGLLRWLQGKRED
jgi:3-oxoacyl-[acyl-carrier-protein] synthase-3